MSDYINREQALAEVEKLKEIHFDRVVVLSKVSDRIEQIPSADVRENIHGTWEEWKGKTYANVPICSNCKHGFPLITKEYNFCPNCGADMRGKT